jgi:hypothetical protein
VKLQRLFVTGLSVAVLLGGAASPALAKADKAPKAPKAPKEKPAGVEGAGVTAGRANFAVEAHQGKPAKGEFHYWSADGSLRVRCNSLDYSPVVYIQAGPPAGHVTGECVAVSKRNRRSPISVDATFVDNGKRGDEANITFTRPDGTTVSDNGPIRKGSIHVH